MKEKTIRIGDLVEIDKDSPDWEHLEEKGKNHCLKGPGIVVEIRGDKYVARFGKWIAYLKESDLIKLTKEGGK